MKSGSGGTELVCAPRTKVPLTEIVPGYGPETGPPPLNEIVEGPARLHPGGFPGPVYSVASGSFGACQNSPSSGLAA
jgi:hypothetical protein